jgi:hypothetical protein
MADIGGTVKGRWRDGGGTVEGRWRDSGGTVEGRGGKVDAEFIFSDCSSLRHNPRGHRGRRKGPHPGAQFPILEFYGGHGHAD